MKNLALIKQFLTEFWALKPVDHPAFRLAGFKAESYQLPAGLKLDPRIEKNFVAQMNAALESAEMPDFGVPMLNSYIHIGMSAVSFGCPVRREPGQEPQVMHIMSSSADLGNLKDHYPNDETNLQLEYQKLLQQHAQAGWGVTHADLQGPTDAVSLIWDYTDMLIAGLTEPQTLKDVLSRVTEFIVRFEREQLAQNPDLNLNHNPGVWLPKGFGVSASEDLLAVVGPDWYREFGTPYNNRLSEEFNGIFIHSCGKFTHNLEVLREQRGLRGVNFNLNEVDIEPLLDALAGRTVLVPRFRVFESEEKITQYVTYLRDKGLDDKHHYYIIDNDGKHSVDETIEKLKALRICG